MTYHHVGDILGLLDAVLLPVDVLRVDPYGPLRGLGGAVGLLGLLSGVRAGLPVELSLQEHRAVSRLTFFLFEFSKLIINLLHRLPFILPPLI